MSSPVLGVLGEGITYSLSPAIFDWAFRETGLDGTYRIFDLWEDKVRDFLDKDHSWTGLNITTPYKELVFAECKSVSPSARATGAVNVVTRSVDGLRGDNTDIAGFQFALKSLLTEKFMPKLILVIGTGGAAKAVLCGLQEMLPSARVEIASRDLESARGKLEDLFSPFASHNVIDVRTAAHFLHDFDLIIQATPVGSVKLPGSPLPEPYRFRKDSAVLDLIYAPRETYFLQRARQDGTYTQNGLLMLIAQAAESFRIWTGREFPLDRAMTELLPQLSSV